MTRSGHHLEPVTAALEVKRQASAAGFDLCGITRAEAFPELGRLREWIAAGHAGQMHYLARTEAKRLDPRLVAPWARRVIVLGTLYNTDRPYSIELQDRRVGRISRYAWGDDYHDVITRRLAGFVEALRVSLGVAFEARSYVDTGPVQEKVLAARAGLGWIGKNTCLVNPVHGSWFFLSVVLTSLELAVDVPEVDHCGTCTLCLEACPTRALAEPGVLDARRCISYLTIELKGVVPAELRPGLGSHVFGCDICQEVCPYNQAAPISRDPAWQPRPIFDQPRLDVLATAADEVLSAALRRSALRRAGIEGLRRTIAIACENATR